MKHTRIDEGVKRPKHDQQSAARPLDGDSWTIPTDLDPDQILLQYLAAGATSGIAKQYGLRRAALTRWLQKVRPEGWREVQVIRALCTKEDGTEQLYDAETALQLSRGRELRRAGEWDLERLDPANYAPKQEHLVTVQPILNVTIVANPRQLTHVLPQQPEQSERIIAEQPEQLPNKG